MKANEIRSWSDTEIQKKIEEAYQELFNLRFQLSTGKSTDTSLSKKVRRDISRMKTVLRERVG